MNRRVEHLHSPAIGAAGTVIAYGHWGRPVLVFPAEAGGAHDFESWGMVDAVADLIDAGRAKVYCVDSIDSQSWSNKGAPIEERARRHNAYESWLLDQVVPWIHGDCGGPVDVLTTGCSMGAFHAANFTLKHGHLASRALCLSGNYDPSRWSGWGERGEAAYFNNPMDYVPNMDGDHLDWLRSTVSLTLVCGQGMWEDTTGTLESTRAFAAVLAAKGIPHELDVWGHDVAHDWPWWRREFAHHLPRFC
ncbi:esterase family protein [Amorphoplanes digitatis]|uniref:Esterase/lipase superfamily enzyme n=1 Tax=Actinoplanes digitatis TaxID=1868 RepID=A0A7W7MSL3_9ACTN|nr:alpha/beta hydrolase-fold protein [Actinoplanes digitatis]MBB4764795.1 esterase/lipase superfamily enzyme [Actinoplanes digitatis]